MPPSYTYSLILGGKTLSKYICVKHPILDLTIHRGNGSYFVAGFRTGRLDSDSFSPEDKELVEKRIEEIMNDPHNSYGIEKLEEESIPASPYVCPNCGKDCKTKMALDSHLRKCKSPAEVEAQIKAETPVPSVKSVADSVAQMENQFPGGATTHSKE